MVRLVAGERAGSGVTGRAIVVLTVDRAGREYGVRGERRRLGWDVPGDPVPEPAAGRRIWVEHQDRVALGGLRGTRPGQLRGDASRGAAPERLRDRPVRAEVGARHRQLGETRRETRADPLVSERVA